MAPACALAAREISSQEHLTVGLVSSWTPSREEAGSYNGELSLGKDAITGSLLGAMRSAFEPAEVTNRARDGFRSKAAWALA